MNRTQIIEDYLAGTLPADELAVMQQRLKLDQGLRSEVRLHQEVNEAIGEKQVIALRQTLDSIHQQTFPTKTFRLGDMMRKPRAYYVAASLALLLSVGGVLLRQAPGELTNQEVYQKYYEPYQTGVTYRSGDAAIDQLLLEAMQHYEAGQYENASALFEKVLNDRSDDMAVTLYSGISAMELERYKKAGTQFKDIINHKKNLYLEQAQWYLALCYIKTDSLPKAQQILNHLATDETFYQEEAQKVLEDIK
jgi:tetratricopeptide (TPR) repeat protein